MGETEAKSQVNRLFILAYDRKDGIRPHKTMK